MAGGKTSEFTLSNGRVQTLHDKTNVDSDRADSELTGLFHRALDRIRPFTAKSPPCKHLRRLISQLAQYFTIEYSRSSSIGIPYEPKT